jgi:lysophospholipase L1-like esterase
VRVLCGLVLAGSLFAFGLLFFRPLTLKQYDLVHPLKAHLAHSVFGAHQALEDFKAFSDEGVNLAHGEGHNWLELKRKGKLNHFLITLSARSQGLGEIWFKGDEVARGLRLDFYQNEARALSLRGPRSESMAFLDPKAKDYQVSIDQRGRVLVNGRYLFSLGPLLKEVSIELGPRKFPFIVKELSVDFQSAPAVEMSFLPPHKRWSYMAFALAFVGLMVFSFRQIVGVHTVVATVLAFFFLAGGATLSLWPKLSGKTDPSLEVVLDQSSPAQQAAFRAYRDSLVAKLEKLEIPKERRRLLFLGGSTTEGVGVTDQTRSWVGQLCEFLKERAEVLCFNAGISNATTNEQLEFYKKEFIKFRPHLVVSSFSYNDRGLEEKFQANMEKLLEINRKHKIATLILVEPINLHYKSPRPDFSFDKNQQYLLSLKEDRLVKLVDLHGPLYEAFDKGNLWWDEIHLTDQGQRFMFRALREALLKRGLLSWILERP